MLIFATHFAEYRWLDRNRYALASLLVVPGAVTLLTWSTDLVNVAARESYWGFWLQRGPLYNYLSFYAFLISSLSVIIVLSVYRREGMRHKKHQASMYAAGFAFPILAGLMTELIAPILKTQMIPMASTLTTVTVLILAFELKKHSFLGFTLSTIAEKVIETMNDMLLVSNADLRVAFVNHAMSETTGYRDEDMVGMPITNLIDGIKGEIRHGRLSLTDFRTVLRTMSGEQVSISVNGTHLTDDKGKVMGYVITVRDVRDLESVVDKLRLSQADLTRSTSDLRKFNQQMAGREKKLAELRDELAKLKKA
jgi:PAS domain S-box-containing protein